MEAPAPVPPDSGWGFPLHWTQPPPNGTPLLRHSSRVRPAAEFQTARRDRGTSFLRPRKPAATRPGSSCILHLNSLNISQPAAGRFWLDCQKFNSLRKVPTVDYPTNSRHMPQIGEKRMHGGMNALDRPDERFEKQVDDYIRRADSNSEDREFWLTFALECLRYAAAGRNRGR
jgi:hypothetical protein